MTSGERRHQLEENLRAVRRRIDDACTASGRDPAEITLVVVTKLFPATDLALLAELGVRHVGENRDQEARDKLTDPCLAGTGLVRHFVGQLQTNKAASVVSYADVVHTADRLRLVSALARAASRQSRRPRVLVQVNLDEDAGPRGRGGAAPREVPALAYAVAAEASLELGGVMAVAPLGGDADTAFARLAEVSERVRAEHPGATWLSAGMSGDLEAAIRHGSTHLRVGSAILGKRPGLR